MWSIVPVRPLVWHTVQSRRNQGTEGPGGEGWGIGIPNLLLLLILAPPDILTFHRAALLPNVLHTLGLFIHVIEGIVCLILGYPYSWH